MPHYRVKMRLFDAESSKRTRWRGVFRPLENERDLETLAVGVGVPLCVENPRAIAGVEILRVGSTVATRARFAVRSNGSVERLESWAPVYRAVGYDQRPPTVTLVADLFQERESEFADVVRATGGMLVARPTAEHYEEYSTWDAAVTALRVVAARWPDHVAHVLEDTHDDRVLRVRYSDDTAV